MFISVLSGQEDVEAACRIADRMGYGDDVAGLGSAAQQGLSGFDFAKGSDSDDDAFFGHDRIAAEDIDFIRAANILDAAVHVNDVIDVHLRCQGCRQDDMGRHGPHGGDVAEVRGYGLEADVMPGRRLTDDEMTVLDHRVDDSYLLPARRRRVDSTVIADADGDVFRMEEGMIFNSIDESEFTDI